MLPLLLLLGLASASAPASTAPRDPFEEYLEVPFPPASGFSPPLGERCDGAGTVQAIGAGRVVEADEQVTLEHLFYENHEKHQVRSTYRGLSRVEVRSGDMVARGQRLGVAQRLQLEIPGVDRPCAFIASRRSLPVPQEEPALVLVHHATYQLRVYARGALVAAYEIGLGQGSGPKEQRGDLKTPMGMYFVIGKSTGPFQGEYADFYGGHWIKVNYPNPYDGDRTKLGGGIGFHGWASEWKAEEGQHLSWGCVVLHNGDIPAFYERVPIGAMVVLF
jgi:L,D-transpeptidase catalytic domain/Peptidase family M23